MSYDHVASRQVTKRKGEYSVKGLCILYRQLHTHINFYTKSLSTCSLLFLYVHRKEVGRVFHIMTQGSSSRKGYSVRDVANSNTCNTCGVEHEK
jgi:hypothetical protein